jgi:hypothetical protein
MINNQLELKEIVVRSNAKFRYFEFLKEFYSLAKENQEISFNGLTNKHKIARGLQVTLVDLKIIKKNSPRNFKWIGNKPSLEMASLILKSQRERYIRISTKSITKSKPIKNIIYSVPKVNSKTIQEPKIKNMISIFWGLIKITKEC